MTSHLNSHGTTDIKPEMLSGVQTGNGTPHDKYNIHGIAHARTNRKDDIFMQRRLVQNFTFILEWGQGICSLTKNTCRWTNYALQYFSTACCLVRFAAFFSLRVQAGSVRTLNGKFHYFLFFLNHPLLTSLPSNQLELELDVILPGIYTFLGSGCGWVQEEAKLILTSGFSFG